MSEYRNCSACTIFVYNYLATYLSERFDYTCYNIEGDYGPCIGSTDPPIMPYLLLISATRETNGNNYLDQKFIFGSRNGFRLRASREYIGYRKYRRSILAIFLVSSVAMCPSFKGQRARWNKNNLDRMKKSRSLRLRDSILLSQLESISRRAVESFQLYPKNRGHEDTFCESILRDAIRIISIGNAKRSPIYEYTTFSLAS